MDSVAPSEQWAPYTWSLSTIYPRVFDFVGVCGNRLELVELFELSVKLVFNDKLLLPTLWLLKNKLKQKLVSKFLHMTQGQSQN